MSVRVGFDKALQKAFLYDSVTDTAFGPVITPLYSYDGMEGKHTDLEAYETAHDFLEWMQERLYDDPRWYTTGQLVLYFGKYLTDVKEGRWGKE